MILSVSDIALCIPPHSSNFLLTQITLETEATNTDSLKLYERLGFCREERLIRYYLNNADAFRLCLPRPIDVPRRETVAAMVEDSRTAR